MAGNDLSGDRGGTFYPCRWSDALCGGYTHGTVAANAVNEHSEYSITIPIYNDKNEKTKRWKEKYLSNELKNKILGGGQYEC